MKKIITTILAAIVALLVLIFGTTRMGDEVEPEGESSEFEVSEADRVDRVIRSPGGKLIRVVGARKHKDATVEDTDLGRTVEVTDTQGRGTCNVLVLKEEKPESKLSDPVSLPGSCPPDDKCVWSLMLRGPRCKAIADRPSYLGSSMREFMRLPNNIKRKFLWVESTSTDPEDPEYVRFGRPKAKPGGKVILLHSWAGRPRLNHRSSINE